MNVWRGSASVPAATDAVSAFVIAIDPYNRAKKLGTATVEGSGVVHRCLN